MTDSQLQLLEKLFDCLGDVVYCVKDREGRYRSVNHAFANRANVRNKAAIIGRSAKDFFPRPLADEYDAQDESVFLTRRGFQDRLEQITNVDGSTGWYLASKFPLFGPSEEVEGLVSISQDLHTPSDSELALSNLNHLVEYIHDHLDQPLKTETLALRLNLTAEQLDRRMKRVFRLSTKKFIMKCRLEAAARRLEETDQPLSVIALACGFTDQSALTRQFRETVLMTPANYRQQRRAARERNDRRDS